MKKKIKKTNKHINVDNIYNTIKTKRFLIIVIITLVTILSIIGSLLTFKRSERFNQNCGIKPSISNRDQINHNIQKIINGKDAESHWPWLVSIRFSENGVMSTHMCGGVLITDQHVLTAAHCFKHNHNQYGNGLINILLFQK
jgi:hypothetical protein